VFAEKGVTLPIMISGTITDLSGRTLSGQTPTAFWHSLRHAEPITIGLNCASARARCGRTSRNWRRSPTRWSAPIRTPACRTSSAFYDESPEAMAALIAEFADAGPRQRRRRLLRHHAGAHPRHRRGGRRQGAARRPEIPRLMRLSGLEPFTLTPDIPFVNVGERTNVTGSARFRKLIKTGDLAAALDVARDQVANGAQIIDVNMDEGLLDSEQAWSSS
jgi:5-methyltetrahydrofolate--homocysteine methyltransferase